MNILWIPVIQLVCVLILMTAIRHNDNRPFQPSDYRIEEWVFVFVGGFFVVGGVVALFALYDCGWFGDKLNWLVKERSFKWN